MRVVREATGGRLHNAILDLLPAQGSVLDVGAGKAGYHGFLAAKASRLVLVDAHAPYLQDRSVVLPAAQRLLGRAEEVLPQLNADFDLALGIDFIEHLPKATAVEVLQHMQRLACRVALFTPSGFHPQDHDLFHEGADEWQTHRSGWTPRELEDLGFDVEVWRGFHEDARASYADQPDFNPDALWAVWRKP